MLVLVPAPWSDLADLLRPSLMHGLDTVGAAVDQGRAAGYLVKRGEWVVGACVLATISDVWGNDLDVVAVAGKGGSENLTAELAGQFEAVARQLGCTGVRGFTTRRGVLRKLDRLGWRWAYSMRRAF